MTDINIPPEALEAVAQKMAHQRYRKTWGLLTDLERELCVNDARAACAAMLKSWPGTSFVHRDWDGQQLMCLPLPKEGA